MGRSRLFLIDSYGFIFRAYHARARSGAPPMRTSTGLSTEAVFIFHNMLRKLRATYNPSYIAAIFESIGPTFRSESFAEYKANRAEMPDDLGQQIPYVRRILEALRIPILQYAGFEADDVIGTISRQAATERDCDVVIVSSDKDMLQLVTDQVHMFNPVKEDVWYDPKTAEEFMGVPPSAVADLLALKGDSIDNIPGAPGIGDKGARDLITAYGSVENAIARAAEVQRKTYRESLLNNKDQILLSKKLATISCDVPIEWSLEDLRAQEPDVDTLKQLYRELEFFSLLKELGPSEAPANRDYQLFSNGEEVREYLSSLAPGQPVAVSVDENIGLSHAEGIGRMVAPAQFEELRPWLLDQGCPKVTHDLKSTSQHLESFGLPTAELQHDIMLQAFLLSAEPSASDLAQLSERYLDRRMGESTAARADTILELHGRLFEQVQKRSFHQLYCEIDLPLARVLSRMERNGIRIEPAQLGVISTRMDIELQALAEKIYWIAGCGFNINSPQQLAKVLYEDLKLPSPVKYGRGKTVSTAADILESLAVNHEIAALVLEYRQVSKLKGTYVDALPALIRAGSGRIHTTFNQTGAATGRLSSSNPNLQNIPIRTEVGREIRAAFVPEPGWNLVVADYSQIELRLLAHMSMDPVLLDAYRSGQDIHTRTAAEVFRVAPEFVTADMRRAAKAVNFGIVYGQTPFGLATSLGIDRKEAESYIKRYFELYSGVKQFIERTIAEVRKTGIAKTMLGRERPIPDMNSRNPNARGFAERTAVNTPLQGTAADLIKIAMVRVDAVLQKNNMASRMLLQVHDELVFEAPQEETDELKTLVKTEMANAAQLEVPLEVGVGVGPNWRDAK
ncbi:MAG TPA: DNA polymerase I [Bryobacteraceae bacterium]|nr:DNA polymerase I [Bryobacteraceae bacterium]